jgi:exopolysaccharide biosynthesis polyprenyl glycosylphosphotransferase
MSNHKQTQSPNLWRLKSRERQVLLAIGDILVAGLALNIGLLFWALGDEFQVFSLDFLRRTPAWFFLLPIFWPLLLAGLYDERRAKNRQETLRGIALAAMIGLGLYLLIYFSSEPKSLPRRGIAGFMVAVTAIETVWRLFYIRVFTAPQFMRRVLLVGAGETGKIILKIIRELTHQPFILVGIIDDDPQKIGQTIEDFPVLAGSDRLLGIITELEITDLIVAISGQMHGMMFQALLDAQELGTEITRMPVAYEELLNRVPIRYLEADWILRSFVDQARVDAFYEFMKRLLDITGGLVGVSMLLLMFPFISVSIFLDSGRPIFYTQVRMGKGAQPYKIFKFRTMRQDAEPDGQPQWAEENDRRATRVGRFLRKTHLDEFPQFINVLRGEMSLVGPRAERPELVDWFQKHVPFYRARLLVKPGITGWAQVNQDYASTIDETIEKLEYDLYYIKHRNLLMDLRVLLRTPSMILGFRGR